MKEKFIKSTIMLVFGGLITKVLSMVIRILITRNIGLEGIGLYMMVMPTFNLFITLSQLGFPIAISKLVSEDKRNNRKIIFSTVTFSLVFNTVLTKSL